MFTPVLPHGLVQARNETDLSFKSRVFGNTTLKVGVVVETIDSDSDQNFSKMGPEYTVMAIEQDGNNGLNTTIYKNCMAIDSFGGVADFFQFKKRASKNPKKVTKKGSLKDQEGEIVLLLCIDGNGEKAVIIGSVAHPERKTSLTKDKNIHAEGEFNGIRFYVDNDGALVITQKTPTDEYGKPKATTSAGSQFKIEKDGSIEMNDKELSKTLAAGNKRLKEGEKEPEESAEESGDGVKNEKIRLDRTKKQIIVEARDNIEVTTDKNLITKVKENSETEIMKDLLLKAEGKAVIEVKGNVEFKTPSTVMAKMMNLQVNFENSAEMKGPNYLLNLERLTALASDSVFINAGSQVVINSPINVIGPTPTPAIVITTAYLGIGNLGSPVVSYAIGPFSSTVYIST